MINIENGTIILNLKRRDNKIYIRYNRLTKLSYKLRFIKCIKQSIKIIFHQNDIHALHYY